MDHPLGRPVPEYQSRPDSSYHQYDGPYHDTHQVNIQLRQYSPTDYSRHQSHPPQNDNRRQRESYQPLPSRYSAPPNRSDHRQSMQQVRPPSNASRGR